MPDRPQFTLATIFYLTAAAAVYSAATRLGVGWGLLAALVLVPVVARALVVTAYYQATGQPSSWYGLRGLLLQSAMGLFLLWMVVMFLCGVLLATLVTALVGVSTFDFLFDLSLLPTLEFILAAVGVAFLILLHCGLWYHFTKFIYEEYREHNSSLEIPLGPDVTLIAAIFSAECLITTLLGGMKWVLRPLLSDLPVALCGLGVLLALPAVFSFRFPDRWRQPAIRDWAFTLAVATLSTSVLAVGLLLLGWPYGQWTNLLCLAVLLLMTFAIGLPLWWRRSKVQSGRVR